LTLAVGGTLVGGHLQFVGGHLQFVGGRLQFVGRHLQSGFSEHVLLQHILDLSEIPSGLFSNEGHGSHRDSDDEREDDRVFNRGGTVLSRQKLGKPIRR